MIPTNTGTGIKHLAKDDILPPRFRTLKKRGGTVDLDVPALLPMLSDY